MTRWLSIIGIGEDGYEALTPAAQTLVENADIVIGGKRHLAMLPSDDGNQISWPPPIHTAVKEIASYKNKKVCVLATGDPFCFGIGRLIADAIPISEISVSFGTLSGEFVRSRQEDGHERLLASAP